jgi:two-component system KDP operon response regulator KdpE
MNTPATLNVLIVDDEPSIRLVLRASLASAGHAVSEAGDVAVAAEAIRTVASPFDVILLDLSMPGVDGAAFIPFIRRESPASRILVVSGSHEGEASDIGADGFLGKPFTRVELLNRIKNLTGC